MRKLAAALFVLLFLLSACSSAAEISSSLSTVLPSQSESEGSTVIIPVLPSKLPNYNAAKDQNADTGGWLYIPGVGIDTVVMHTEDNNDYLRTNFYGAYDVWGVPFIDQYCAPNAQGRNTIVYGHSSQSGRGFGALFQYRDPAFAAENQFIQLTTAAGDGIYLIFSVFVTLGEGVGIFDYTQTDFISDADYQEFIETAVAKSEIDFAIYPDPGSRVLTLQTCAYDYDGARFVVMALEINN